MPADIDRLFALARDRTPAARRTLIDELVARFEPATADSTPGDRERALLDDVLERLLAESAEEVRQGLAERLASSNRVPREAVRALAHDTIDVARPILLRNGRLSDDDLLQVIATKGPPHQASIAQRRQLSVRVGATLARQGTTDVAVALLRNRTATIDRDAQIVLSDRARYEQRLQRPLLERPELASDLAARLYWWAGRQLRAYIDQRWSLPADMLASAIEDTIRELLDGDGPDFETLADREALDSDLLAAVLRRGQRELFRQLWSARLDLPASLAASLLRDANRRLFALACRACGFSREATTTLFLLARSAGPGEAVTDDASLNDVLAAFDKLSVAAAAERLATWARDPRRLQRELQGGAGHGGSSGA